MPTPRKRQQVYGLRLVREATFQAVDYDGRVKVSDPATAAGVLWAALRQEVAETFLVLALDAQHRLMKDGVITITRGIVNASLVHPREVFRPAILVGASAIILGHNHPSGDPTPSSDDRMVTEQLVTAGRLLDIPVHDHLVLGSATRYTSFALAGLL